MTARYAVYYAPDPASELWRKGSAWLGRDADTGMPRDQKVPKGFSAETFAKMTAAPRRYGFHGTLKAPFVLADGATEEHLLNSAARFAAGQSAFTAAIAPQILGRFIAFRLLEPCPAMLALHARCMEHFEPFRKPLNDADIARRRQNGLTAEQDARLLQWGYPHVFDGFRFHMTLSSSIEDETERAAIHAVACARFGAAPQDHRFDSISVFHQHNTASPFTIIGRFGFDGTG
jgi:putative phosphonate metabolism protein